MTEKTTKPGPESSCKAARFVQRFRHPLFICLLVLLTWSAFSNILGNDFIDFDDTEYIVDNPYVRMGLTKESVQWAFTHFFMGNWHPLALLSHMADVELFGLDPAGHHLSSLLLHMLTALILFEWLYRLTGAFWSSAAAALLWTVHPLRVESVAWAAERKDVLCGFFGILALWAYTAYARRPAFCRYGLTIVFFLLGLLSKGMIVTWPFLFLLLDVWPLGRFRQRQDAVRLFAEKLPFFAISFLFSLILLSAQKHGGAVSDWAVCPFPIRLENAALSYFRYLWKMIWPAGLSILYPFWPQFHPLRLAAALFGLGAVSAAACTQIRKRGWIFTGWFWYLITLLPVIGLVQIGRHCMADRYTYLPSIGIHIAVLWSVRQWACRNRLRTILSAAAFMLSIGAFLFVSWMQTYRWQNTLTLFEHSIRVTGDNPTLEINLAYRLAKLGQIERAIETTESVLQRHPKLYQAAVNLGSFYLQKKDYTAALSYLQKALLNHPQRREEVLGYMGAVYKQMGQLDTAKQCFQECLRSNPHHARVLTELGEIRLQQGRPAEAVDLWQQALGANPYFLPALENLAWTRAVCADESIRQPEKALELAQRLCALSSRITPRQLDILAAAYAACGDFQRAAMLAEQALQLLADDTDALRTGIEERLRQYQSEKPFLEKDCMEK